MVKVYFGSKGMGKTVRMIESANNLASEGAGNVIFIDSGKELICSLNHNVRFINIDDYPVRGSQVLQGFISGIMSCNYDIGSVFIDGLGYITGEKPDNLNGFFNAIRNISDTENVDFYVSLSGNESEIPEYLKEYI